MADLATRLDTHIRYREARGASKEELGLLHELAAMLPKPVPEVALTPRQAEILPLLLEGQSIKACARILGISPDTAKEHAHRLYKRYDVHSRYELLALFGKAERIQ